MRCAVIKDNLVVNLIVADANVDAAPEGHTLINVDESVNIGATYDPLSDSFANPEPPTPQIVVPYCITRRQCAMQLFSLQMISSDDAIAMTQTGTPPAAIQVFIDQMNEPDRTMAMLDFAAMEYQRNSVLLASLMTANGMTDQQIDQFFIAAAAL